MSLKKIIQDIEHEKKVIYKSELASAKYYRVLVFVNKAETEKYRVEVFDRKKISSNFSYRSYFYHTYNNMLLMKSARSNIYLPFDELFSLDYIALFYTFPEKGNLTDMLTSCKKFNEEQVMMIA